MTKYQTNVILLLISGLFLIPFLIPDTTTTLLPSEDRYVVINLLSPELVISSTNDATFTMSLFKLESDESLITIFQSSSPQTSFTITNLSPGQYQIYLKSFFISEISISQSGIYSVSIVLLIFINAINFYILIKRNYFSDF